MAALSASTLTSRPGPGAPVRAGLEPVEAGAYPEVVAIVVGPRICTGALVSDRWVLTAGHCLRGVEPAGVRVGAGRSIAATEWVSEVGRVVIHPKQCSSCESDLYDFGLVELAQPRPLDAYPRPLRDQATFDASLVAGARVVTVGFGADATGSSGTKRVIAGEFDRFVGTTGEFLTQAADGGTCAGDSGGPAFVEADDGTLLLVGVLSRGSKDCSGVSLHGLAATAGCWVEDATGGSDFGCDAIAAPDARDPQAGCALGPGATPPGAAGVFPWVVVLALACRRLARGRLSR